MRRHALLKHHAIKVLKDEGEKDLEKDLEPTPSAFRMCLFIVFSLLVTPEAPGRARGYPRGQTHAATSCL